MSFTALGLSIYNTVTLNNGSAQANDGKVLISKKYDKGQSLAKAYKKQKPVLVFFYADWCGFCQRFAPTFYKVTKDREIKKTFAVAYVNCDKPENREYMQQFNVQGFPTVYVINNDRSKVQLENSTFFNEDSADVIKTNMLNIIKNHD
jgi:thiol:disulfide interchange protein